MAMAIAEPDAAQQAANNPVPQGVYDLLAAPFDKTFRDNRGGVDLEYITGFQVTDRLNRVLGVDKWSFRVLEHGFDKEADEFWALGEITAEINGTTVTRAQFGSQKVKRSRSTGAPLDIGFDKKGAGTDAMKKCASLLGVGLYLSEKGRDAGEADGHQRSGARPASGGSRSAPATRTAPSSPARSDGVEVCEVCHAPLRETRFKDGTTWGPQQLAGYGRRKHGKVLCMDHYRAATEARRAGVLNAGPFDQRTATPTGGTSPAARPAATASTTTGHTGSAARPTSTAAGDGPAPDPLEAVREYIERQSRKLDPQNASPPLDGDESERLYALIDSKMDTRDGKSHGYDIIEAIFGDPEGDAETIVLKAQANALATWLQWEEAPTQLRLILEAYEAEFDE